MSIRLETERLRLAPIAPQDEEPHAALMAHPGYAATMTPDGVPSSRGDAWRAFAAMLGHWSIRGYGFFSVFERSSGAWVGRVGPWRPEGWPGLECGWSIAPAHWGKGYAGEAAIAATRWLFAEQPELSRIISLIAPTNLKSQSVARKMGETKSGETCAHGAAITLDVWAAEREAWLDRFGRV